MWVRLPCDLLVEIFRRLGQRSRPMRRRLHRKRNAHRYTELQHVPGLFENVITSDTAETIFHTGGHRVRH